ncbi:MAG: hypothetical protein HOW73_01600 [Polyangiaceae bacterium]|nr:hypothetical protein [Polyangiaceae bacterium]
MKLCVACLARTDMSRPSASASEGLGEEVASGVRALDSIFDAEEDVPTTLYVPARSTRNRARTTERVHA